MSSDNTKSENSSSLNEARSLFEGLARREPTLEMALREAGVQNYEVVLENAMEFADLARDNPEIAALGLTDDEAAAISCYTLQCAEGVKSPYQIINDALVNIGKDSKLYSTRKLVYLFLSGLRKLPRFRPSGGQMLYRGVRIKVPMNEEEANGHQFYAKGRTVTWHGFTSTAPSLEPVSAFISGASSSTLFNIGGQDLWGYKISAFSPFSGEEEIILEPEAKMLVNGVASLGNTLVVNLALQPFDHLVLEDIIPPKAN